MNDDLSEEVVLNYDHEQVEIIGLEIMNHYPSEFDVLNYDHVQVEISGLEIMNDDPSEVDVLYAKVGQADQLQDVAEKIIDRYIVF